MSDLVLFDTEDNRLVHKLIIWKLFLVNCRKK